MNENTDLKLTANAWAEIVIKIWKEKVLKMKIRDTNALFLSFASSVITNANGNPERILFAFNYYGRFTELGVGNGVTAEEQETMYTVGLTRRKKKPWFYGAFNYQTEKLTEILEEKYGLKIASTIVTSLDEKGKLMGKV